MTNLVIMRQGWVLYDLCLLSPLERVIGMELSGFVALIYGLDIYRDDTKVAWDSHEFKVIDVNKLQVTPTNLPLVWAWQVKKSVFHWYDYLAAIFAPSVCYILQQDWRM